MSFYLTYNLLISAIQDYTDNNNQPGFAARIPQFIQNAEIRIARELKMLDAKQLVNSTFLPGQAVYQRPNRWRQTISMNYGTNPLFTSTSRQNSGGLRTVIFSAAHSFKVGGTINTFNFGGSGYNGSFPISAVTQFSVSYTSGSGSEALTSDTNGVGMLPASQFTPILDRGYEYCRQYWPDLTKTDLPQFYGDFDFNNFIVVPTPVIAFPFQLVYYETPEHLDTQQQTSWMTQNVPDMLLYASLLETAPYLKNDDRKEMWEDFYNRAAAAQSNEAKSRTKDSANDRETGT